MYVGQTKNLERRNKAWRALKYAYGNQLLSEERKKYGLDSFETVVLQECDSEKELDRWERHYIKFFNTLYPNGYNDNVGGRFAFSHSERTKKKISEAKKGHTPYNKGKTLEELFDNEKAEEIRKKLSDFAKTRIGEKNPFFGKTFKTHPMLNKHHSDETKKKLSDANRNGKLAIPIVQLTDDGEIIEWKSQREASRHGYDCGSISKAVRGVYFTSGHHYKGSDWYFKSDYEEMLAGLSN